MTSFFQPLDGPPMKSPNARGEPHGQPENSNPMNTNTPIEKPVAAVRVGSSPLLGSVVRNDDRTVTANVAVTLTKEQWLEYEHAFRIRGMSCEIGLDSPQVTDRVMFQIFKQITLR